MYAKYNDKDSMMSMCCDTCDDEALMCLCGYWSWMQVVMWLLI